METGFLVFIGVCVAVSVSPGPAVLFIVARTLDQGVAAGLASMAGITVGGIAHVLLAAFGVAAVAAAWPLSLTLVQIGGALYLIWIGVQRIGRGNGAGTASVDESSLAEIFRQGVIVNLTNPKTVLFLLAFLPQFVDPAAGQISRQLVLLGLTFVAVAAVTDGAYVLTAGLLRERFSGGQTPRWSGFLAGGVYVGLGLLGLYDAARQLTVW